MYKVYLSNGSIIELNNIKVIETSTNKLIKINDITINKDHIVMIKECSSWIK